MLDRAIQIDSCLYLQPELNVSNFYSFNKTFLSEFHHCPYIRLIGQNDSAVGCLLHPLGKGNRGVDFRGLSFYGGMACRIYFCPSYRFLQPSWKEALKISITDWYLYGLIVTEHRLFTSIFQEIEYRIGRRIDSNDFSGSDNAQVALGKSFSAYNQCFEFLLLNDFTAFNLFFEPHRVGGAL